MLSRRGGVCSRSRFCTDILKECDSAEFRAIPASPRGQSPQPPPLCVYLLSHHLSMHGFSCMSHWSCPDGQGGGCGSGWEPVSTHHGLISLCKAWKCQGKEQKVPLEVRILCSVLSVHRTTAGLGWAPQICRFAEPRAKIPLNCGAFSPLSSLIS